MTIDTARWQDIDTERKRLHDLGLSRFPDLDERKCGALDFMAATGAMVASTNGRVTNGRLYRSFEELVIARGDHFEWQPRPSDVAKMQDKQCYFNALTTALDRGWRYVEGYACKMLVTMHAWCVDEHGRVIDPTWGEVDEFQPHLYVGISMDPDKAWEYVCDQEVYGILPQGELRLLDGELDDLI